MLADRDQAAADQKRVVDQVLTDQDQVAADQDQAADQWVTDLH